MLWLHVIAAIVAIGSRDVERAAAFISEVGLEGAAPPYGSYQEVRDKSVVGQVGASSGQAGRGRWRMRQMAVGLARPAWHSALWL